MSRTFGMRRWVVKIGSALITGNDSGLHRRHVREWARQISELRCAGLEVIMVSSGAIAEGSMRLGWKKRPAILHRLQAAAAVGQSGLAHCWEEELAKYSCRSAQILLSRADIEDRSRYLNARATLLTLLELGVTPVINENDTVTTEEIRLGNNDILAGHISSLVDADLLVILTDQNGLYECDPRLDPDAALIPDAYVHDLQLDRAAGGGAGRLGQGGMKTKIQAARLAAQALTDTVITDGRMERVLQRLAADETIGSYIHAVPEKDHVQGAEDVRKRKMDSRKRWIAGLQADGAVQIDDGAVEALRKQGGSLLAVGVCAVDAGENFVRGNVVNCCDSSGTVIARGLINYEASEVRKIRGLSSSKIEACLGYRFEEELIHRDNLVIL